MFFFSGGGFSGTVTFDWHPDPLIIAEQADQAAANVNMMQRPLRIAMGLARQNIEQHFLTATGPDGEAWEDWSDYKPDNSSWKSYAEKAAGQPGILIQTGGLMGEATSRGAFTVTNREVFYARPSPLGDWHDEGLPGRQTRWGTPNDLPQRKFAGIDAATQAAIVEAFDVWFGDAIEVLVQSGGRRAFVRRDPASGRFLPRG